MTTSSYVIATPTSRQHTYADAVCDGVQDNEEFSTALHEFRSIGGGRLVFLEGDYYFQNASDIHIPDNVIIEGQGASTRIHLQGDSTPFYFNRASNAAIKNICVLLASSTRNKPAIKLFSTNVAPPHLATTRNCCIEGVSIRRDEVALPDEYTIVPCTGLELDASTDYPGRPQTDTSILANAFTDLQIRNCATGILFRIQDDMPNKTAFISHNQFDRIVIATFQFGISFIISPGHTSPIVDINRNIFRNIIVQPTKPYDSFEYGIHSVLGRNNLFENAVVYDMNAVEANNTIHKGRERAWTIDSKSRGTVLLNCEFRGEYYRDDSPAGTGRTHIIGPNSMTY